jgi:hypothetical protein
MPLVTGLAARTGETPVSQVHTNSVVSGAGLFGLLNTKKCIKRNATRVAGGTAKSLAMRTLVVKLDRQRSTMAMVVNQLAATTAKYYMSCRT